jgi:hypothetical protein
MPLRPIIIRSPERERWLDAHLPYRIEILRGLDIYNSNGGPGGRLRPVFPSIFEAALIACRWSACFLGLRLDKASLRQATKRQKPNDVFAADLGGTLIDPAALPRDQRVLLISVLKGANVASAHPAREGAHSMVPEDVDAASALMIVKLRTHVYDVLGLRLPRWSG